jgi:hypothetical protein
MRPPDVLILVKKLFDFIISISNNEIDDILWLPVLCFLVILAKCHV